MPPSLWLLGLLFCSTICNTLQYLVGHKLTNWFRLEINFLLILILLIFGWNCLQFGRDWWNFWWRLQGRLQVCYEARKITSYNCNNNQCLVCLGAFPSSREYQLLPRIMTFNQSWGHDITISLDYHFDIYSFWNVFVRVLKYSCLNVAQWKMNQDRYQLWIFPA